MEEKIIFIHIPKTAGTSLRNLIEQEYPGKKCLRLYYPAPYKPAVIKEIQSKLPAAKVLYGHTSFGIHKRLGIQGQYITFLRNPIDRVISFYNHNACLENATYYAAIQEGMSLLDMLQSEITHETNNHVTRIIAPNGQPGLLDDTRVLKQALENIEKHFCMVGLMEQFAESIDLLGKKLGWQSSYKIPHLNVVAKKHIQEVDAQTQAALEKYNRLDMLLYEHIRHNFENS